ncbi:DUF7352 domain-containing protein [Isoalcanivorax beigongshangi]|uniref:DUF7352 domain-containing protein n=1 Tax=Isoalcanivorax beigongshangi TaxID=3238810 RepID=A0ABV4AHW4_9GAMM
MKTIMKHRLSTKNDVQRIKLPEEGIVREVAFSYQERDLCLWVEVPAGSVLDNSAVERSFKVFRTGDGIPDNARYIGSALEVMRPDAFHVFELFE